MIMAKGGAATDGLGQRPEKVSLTANIDGGTL